MNELLERMKKNSTIKEAAILSKSTIFDKKDVVTTSIPLLNVALSGDPDGGLTSGITQIAGPSRHFKTLFALIMAKAYMDKFPESIFLFYENEFGTTRKYFKSLDIDEDRVLHTPITDIEVLKADIMNQLEGIKRGDKVFILIDSIGNIASRKEVEDALDAKVVVDMTRAKALKSLFRMVTPQINLKNLPLVVINHTYKTLEMFSKDQTSGGTGAVYSADTIWIIGRQQDKDNKEKTLQGYNFTINIDKSRYVKEKSKLNITVSFEEGVNKWSGLFDEAVEAGIIHNVSKGKYSLVNFETGEPVGNEFKQEEVDSNDAFWKNIFETTNFRDILIEKYRLGEVQLLQDIEMETEENE